MPEAVISQDWEHLPHFHIILPREQENCVDPETENKLCKTLSGSGRINVDSGLGVCGVKSGSVKSKG